MSGGIRRPGDPLTTLSVKAVGEAQDSVGDGGHTPGYFASREEGGDQTDSGPGVVVEITGEEREDPHALARATGVRAYEMVEAITNPKDGEGEE